MTMRTLLLCLSAAAFGAAASAQHCPKERTTNVPASVIYGPIQSCGGFSYQLPGVTVQTIPNGCPLHLIYTPTHQLAEPSPQETMVASAGVAQVTMTTFVCQTRWLLFVPIGTSCVVDRTLNIGVVPLLTTVPCKEGQA